MIVKRIIHTTLEPVEYYFCVFQKPEDIQNFAKTCSWFHEGDLDIQLNEPIIIKYDKSIEGDNCEKLYPAYFKTQLAHKIEVYTAVLNEAQAFFR